MTATPDGEYLWICRMENHFSKFHILFALKNKEAATVARAVRLESLECSKSSNQIAGLSSKAYASYS